MVRNHRQVIEQYRKIKMDLAALGMTNWASEISLHMEIAKCIGYTYGTTKKIIEKYKNSEEWKKYEDFLNNIPSIYEEIKPYLSKHVVYSKIYESN